MKTPIIIWLIINILVWSNYSVNKPQQDFELKCKVIGKSTQDKLIHHKNYNSSEGFRRTFLVYNQLFGYGEIQTTINTYMTTKEGETVTFCLSRRKVAEYFDKHEDLSESLMYDAFFLIIFFGGMGFCVSMLLSLCIKYQKNLKS